MEKQRTYFCIDMKSFYASVECAERGLDPFSAKLAVLDDLRGKNAICLAITPAMKALGIKNRCRLSEIPKDIDCIHALPRMHLYIQYSADIYSIYLDYFDKNDIHVYSIDEAFIDVTDYLKLYGVRPKTLAKKLMAEIREREKIPATVGIGTNLYLAKIALDITAKHSPDGIGFLDEESYRKTLWAHKPITDFWQIGEGTRKRLERAGIFDMEGIAKAPPEKIYRLFGVDAELLIDHAWGREPCLMEDIKNYRSCDRSISASQILPRNYTFEEARTVLLEMVSALCSRMIKQGTVTTHIGVAVGYAFGTAEVTGKAIKMPVATALYSQIKPYALKAYESATLRSVPIRRIMADCSDLHGEEWERYDLFTDAEKAEREKRAERAMVEITDKFGRNSLLRGTSYLKEGTQRERNTFIGGHRAGFNDKTSKG